MTKLGYRPAGRMR